MSLLLTGAELKAISSAIYNSELMVKQMHTIDGISGDQIIYERTRLKIAKRGLKKLRDAKKAARQPIAVAEGKED